MRDSPMESVVDCGKIGGAFAVCLAPERPSPHHAHRRRDGMAKRQSIEERFWSKVDKSAGPNGCWIWTGTASTFGHGAIRVGGRDTPKIGAHRLSYILHHGPIPDGMLVCHRCDVPGCVNPSHLFVGTYSDNSRDMASKGRSRGLKGESHPQARHTEEFIRAILLDGRRNVDISRALNVSERFISRIKLRRRWSHVSI